MPILFLLKEIKKMIRSKRKKVSQKEYNETYAALKVLQAMFKEGKIKEHVFKNILNDHKEVIDLSEFQCYA